MREIQVVCLNISLYDVQVNLLIIKIFFHYIYGMPKSRTKRWTHLLFAFSICSTFLCLVCPCLHWDVEHYATVTLTFIDKGNETELKIECRAVPESEEDRTREGWQRYYCQAIKQTFGFGARLCWDPTSTITILAFSSLCTNEHLECDSTEKQTCCTMF